MRQALYRKYRPKTFEQIYGQDNIVNILKNQIINNKISHAYIFSGTRGTGKTSTAKIFAKAVNCLNPQDGSPCNECLNCRIIEEESTMDIVEMDAASNRGVDDIRQIREQVIYPPTTLKYKVYIIDEAHMITKEGFNALLKMMEEPPKHLIFILATTEIDRIPDTILSRTQRFEFKSLGINDIKAQIKEILKNEDISLDERAIEIIANVASGAMRDALSILDQVVSIGKSHITSSDVYDLLGLFSDEVKIEYAKLIFNKDIKNLLALVDRELNKGKDANNFIKEIITFFKDIIYIKIDVKENYVDDLIDDISLEQLVNTLDILLEYEQSMKKSDSSALLFRLASVRLIDYMPRKHLESQIKNLEERVLRLEETNQKLVNLDFNKIGKVESGPKNNPESFKKVLEDYDKENLEPEEYKEIEEEISEIKDTDLENEKIEDSNEEFLETEEPVQEVLEAEDSIEKNVKSDNTEELFEDSNYHIKLFKEILVDNKHTLAKLIMKEVQDIKITRGMISIYIPEDVMSRANALSTIFSDAIEELNQKTNEKYEYRFAIYREKANDDIALEKNIEEIKRMFPGDKLNIKERK